MAKNPFSVTPAEMQRLRQTYKGKTTKPVNIDRYKVDAKPRAKPQPKLKVAPMPSIGSAAQSVLGALRNAPQGLADLAVALPTAAYDYVRTSTPSSVAGDIKRGVTSAVNAVRENPGETFADLVAGGAKGTGKMLREASLARDAGDEERAAQIESLAVPMLLASLVPGGRAIKGAERMAVREGVEAAERGVARATVPAVPVTPEMRNPLMGLHNINERKLGMANRLGGLPVPSIAVANPELGFEGFGNISLVAPQKLVAPAPNNPVFAADVYSARFPALNDEETKIFRGYTDNGRRYSPLTMANVVREMKGNPRNAEGSNYGAGSVRAVVTPQFKSVREMQNAREQIIPSAEFQPLKDEANDRLYALGERFLPFSKYSRPSILDFPEQLAEAARVGFHDLDYNYEGLPPELLDEARGYLDYLRDMPTEYFEAKPQRGVKLSEFAGAVVPKDTSDEVIQLLQNQGVPEIQRYDPDRLRGLPTRKEALERFRVHRFAVGGSV